ncbi:MAG: hypothetical protein SWY16_11145 [Cyanobacteriota bacterium]|nr:hypothetical protein [Cyanobacteriota bacterium]
MSQRSRAEGNSEQVGRDKSSDWKIINLFANFNIKNINKNIVNNSNINNFSNLVGVLGLLASVLILVFWEKIDLTNFLPISSVDLNEMGSMLGSPNKATSSSPKNAPTVSNTKAGTTKKASSIRDLHHSHDLLDDLSPNRVWARLKNLSPNDEWWSLNREGAATGMYDVENLDLDNVYGWRFENGVSFDFTSDPMQVFLDRTTGAVAFGASRSSKLIDESALRKPELVPGMPESVLEMPASKSEMLKSVLEMPEVTPGAPELVADLPKSESGMPDLVADSPEFVPGIPEFVTDLPEPVLGMPGVAPGAPELVADLPESVPGMPDLVTDLPESVPGMPEPVSGIPELVADLPESVPEIPELMTETVESARPVSEPSPSPFASIPIGVCIFLLRKFGKKR